MNKHELLKELTDQEYEKSKINPWEKNLGDERIYIIATPNLKLILRHNDIIKDKIYEKLNEFEEEKLKKMWFNSI